MIRRALLVTVLMLSMVFGLFVSNGEPQEVEAHHLGVNHWHYGLAWCGYQSSSYWWSNECLWQERQCWWDQRSLGYVKRSTVIFYYRHYSGNREYLGTHSVYTGNLNNCFH